MAKSKTIIIGGLSGTGSTTAAKQLATQLGFEHVYAGAIFRQMSKEAGMSIEDYMVDIVKHPERERAVDDRLLKRAAEGRAVIESRVLHWLVPKDQDYFTAWLTCDFPERVRRIREREPFRDQADAEQHVSYRDGNDAKRYKELYDVDITNFSAIDALVDTTSIAAGAATDRIFEAYQKS